MIDYGTDVLNIDKFNLLEISELLDTIGCSLSGGIRKNEFKFIPNRGLPNQIEVDYSKKILMVNYTSPDGREKSKEAINKIKEGLEKISKKKLAWWHTRGGR